MLCNIEEFKAVEIDGGNITSPKGFKANGINCGIRKIKRDLAILISDVPAISAAVYTTNQFQAAPIIVTKQSLAASETQRAIIVNSGNANAFTSKQGIDDAIAMRNQVAKKFDLKPDEVTIASTGVIGQTLPMETIIDGINLLATTKIDEVSGLNFSEAIITTDTVTKSLAVEVEVDGIKVVIGGTAKGSGMIHPNMATMLAFITTDANVDKGALQRLLKGATDNTFNMITVDGDTSTNDMVLVMANGLAGNKKLNEEHPDWNRFCQGFTYVSEQLAKMIAKDGEGATKLITVKVTGAKNELMAKNIAKKIIGSNLVKTAVFGADANWGRLIMAIGNSGYQVDENLIDINIGEVEVLKNGKLASYEEEFLVAQLNKKEVDIEINFNLGTEYATAWGCDLTYDYVRINASYRT